MSEKHMSEPDLEAIARAIIDRNLYLVLGTADAEGRPWVSPVYYAPSGYREFLWVSDPGTRHSRNIAARAEISIVVFDSQAPISTGQGVYMSAVAAELEGDERDRAVEVFSRRTQEHGGAPWGVEQVRPPARHRLYRAVAHAQWGLDATDRRVPVEL
jgi:nitroimidazol reductase NimA-like FMN-containing flavoprotein (pyridoxamine 5'-phosphate oxidase superfamily)